MRNISRDIFKQRWYRGKCIFRPLIQWVGGRFFIAPARKTGGTDDEKRFPMDKAYGWLRYAVCRGRDLRLECTERPVQNGVSCMERISASIDIYAYAVHVLPGRPCFRASGKAVFDQASNAFCRRPDFRRLHRDRHDERKHPSSVSGLRHHGGLWHRHCV